MSAILTGLVLSGLLAVLLVASGVIFLIVWFFFKDDLRLKQVQPKVEERWES